MEDGLLSSDYSSSDSLQHSPHKTPTSVTRQNGVADYQKSDLYILHINILVYLQPTSIPIRGKYISKVAINLM